MNGLIIKKTQIKGNVGGVPDTIVAATIDSVSATTLPAGSAATAENTGTNKHATFVLGIPKGEKGEAGTTDYNDLVNKPTIPTKTSELTNDSNFPVDAKYVHTDNNFTTTDKQAIADNATAIGNKVDKVAGKQLSTEDYTTAEKEKLSDIDLTKYPTIVEQDAALALKADKTEIVDLAGATATADGSKGYAPKPLIGDQNKFLKGDGTWADLDYDLSNFAGAEFDGAHSEGTKKGLAADWTWAKSTEVTAGTDDYKSYEPFDQQCYLMKLDSNGNKIREWEGTSAYDAHLDDADYGADQCVCFRTSYAKRVIYSSGKDFKGISTEHLPGYSIPRCFYRNGLVIPYMGITIRQWCDDGNGGITTRKGLPIKKNITEAQFETLERAKGFFHFGINELSYLQHLGSIKYANLNWQNAVDYGIDSAYYNIEKGCTVTQTAADSIIVSNANAAYVSIGDTIYFSGTGSQQTDLPVTAIARYDTDNTRITIAGLSLTSVVGDTGFYRSCYWGGGTDGILGLDGYRTDGTIHKRSVKTLNIENLFGNRWLLMGGAFAVGTDLYINSDPENNPTWPSDAADALAQGWVKHSGTLATTSGYIKKFMYDKNFPLVNFAESVGGDSNNPVGDYHYPTYSTASPSPVLACGGLSCGVSGGPFVAYLVYGVTTYNWNFGGFGVDKPLPGEAGA